MICRVSHREKGQHLQSSANAYLVKLYEKLRKKWRNVVISVWIGRDHNYRTYFFFFNFYFLTLFRWGILDLVFFFAFSLILILSSSHPLYFSYPIYSYSSFFFSSSSHARPINLFSLTHFLSCTCTLSFSLFFTMFLSLSLHITY